MAFHRLTRATCALSFGTMLVLSTASAHAQVQPTQPTQASLVQAEDALFKADIQGDVGAIQQGFADEAIFIHVNGMTQTKADYLQATAAHAFPIKSIETENRIVRVFGNVGVVRGTKTLVVGNGMHLSGTYLTVYLWRDGRWQMLSEQSSPMPPTQTPPSQK